MIKEAIAAFRQGFRESRQSLAATKDTAQVAAHDRYFATLEALSRRYPGDSRVGKVLRGALVDAYYVEILGRRADPGGLQDYSKALVEGRLTGGGLRKVLASSDEFTDHFVTNPTISQAERIEGLYKRVMGRRIDPTGRAGYIESMTNPVAVRQALLDSEEFRKRFK